MEHIRGHYYTAVICFYSCIPVSSTISISYDVCVVEKATGLASVTVGAGDVCVV
jgi:hypothetical protein